MIRVLIVDDAKIVRAGLAILLRREKDIRIVGEARNGREALELVGKLDPDVILMDLKMPGLDGLETTRIICEQDTHRKVLIHTVSCSPTLLRTALAYGAKGYIAKSDGMLELPTAIRTIYASDAYFSPSVAKLLPPPS